MTSARRFMWGLMLGSCLLATPMIADSQAQTMDPNRPAATDTDMDTNRDRDFDWGWLGLLGLVGLAGLRRPGYRVETGAALGAR